jgi:hypothetical protein
MSFKVGKVEVPLTTKNFKRSDGGLFGLAALVIIVGSLFLMMSNHHHRCYLYHDHAVCDPE